MRSPAAYGGATERPAILGRWRGAPSHLTAQWPFPTAAALGSSVRAKGIERELRARLGSPGRKTLYVADRHIHLRVPRDQAERLAEMAAIVVERLNEIDALPVLPGEVDDILAVAPRERLRWTRGGRLISAGTRTATLHGTGRKTTFHIFDPCHIEDVLDRCLVDVWREEDRDAVAEVRRWAAGRAALSRGQRKAGSPSSSSLGARHETAPDPQLAGWDAFGAVGLLQ